jgi:FkbM family methyltransferase
MNVPILAGRLRGRWWSLSSRGQPGRVLTGTYERAHTRLFEKWVFPGSIVLDLGAHVGYYTLLSSRLAGDTGKVYSFEPDPRNCRNLRRHVRINRLRNVHVEESAVADVEGTARFQTGTGSGTGRLGERGTLRVSTLVLDAYCRSGSIQPNLVKIDVEGAEMRVLEGARATLVDFRPTIILSTHGADIHRQCITFLRTIGYALHPITGEDPEHTTELLALAR